MLLTNSDTMALGELIIELSGKITGQRVLDVEGPTIERSIVSKGTIRGVQVQDITTFIGRPTAEKGVLHSVGQGGNNYDCWQCRRRTRNGNTYRRGNRKIWLFRRCKVAWICLH
jgi:hypothetical protein